MSAYSNNFSSFAACLQQEFYEALHHKQFDIMKNCYDFLANTELASESLSNDSFNYIS